MEDKGGLSLEPGHESGTAIDKETNSNASGTFGKSVISSTVRRTAVKVQARQCNADRGRE